MKNPYKFDKRYRVQSELFEVGFPDSDELYKTLYLTGAPACDHPMSCIEIAEWLYSDHGISVTPKTVQYNVNKMGIKRTKSESKRLAMKTGRMVYRKKPEHEKYKSKSISALIRFKVMQRDNYKCCLCGNTRENGYSLEIHHKNGPDNDINNLQTLCFLCHRGLHLSEREEKQLKEQENTCNNS